MTVPYRCTHHGCRARVTLKRRRERYLEKPKCPSCGRELTGKPDFKMRVRDKRRACDCGEIANSKGSQWPHRKGSIKWCRYSALPLTDEDYAERYGSAA